MKKIEEGCLALVVHSFAGNTGKTVRVGRFLGDSYRRFHLIPQRRWEITPALPASNGLMLNSAPESCLMRIDGHHEEFSELVAFAKEAPNA